MSSSWNQIAYYTAEKGLDQASESLSASLQSSIPSLDQASLKCALLQCSDHAYKAIHTFVEQFGAIEDLLRGSMSRQRYGQHVEWVSDAMVDTWKEQLRNRELESCKSLPTISTPSTLSKELPPSPPSPSQPAAFPWLADKLSKTTQMSPTDISKIVQILVREGIDNEVVLTGNDGRNFTSENLSSIDIQASPSHSTAEEVASAKDLRDLKLIVENLIEKVGSLSNDTDSEVVVGSGNQKMISLSKQSSQQPGPFSSSELARLANVESAYQEIVSVLLDVMCHLSLQAKQELVSSPEMTAKHKMDKKCLFNNSD